MRLIIINYIALSPRQKLTVPQVIKKHSEVSLKGSLPYPPTASHLFLPSARPAQSTPSIIFKIHFNIILGLLSRLFASRLAIVYLYPLPTHAKRPACLILLHLIIRITGEQYKSWSSPLCSLIQSPLTSTISLSATHSTGWTLEIKELKGIWKEAIGS